MCLKSAADGVQGLSRTAVPTKYNSKRDAYNVVRAARAQKTSWLKVRAARARKKALASLAPSAFLTVTCHVVRTKILEKSFMFIKRPVYLTGRLSPPPTRSPSLITPFLSYFCTIPERF